MADKKKILVEIENKQLNALEDLLTAELSEKERVKAKKLSLKLWKSLVSAYDNEIDEFTEQESMNPLALFNALEVIMKNDESFYDPKVKTLPVQDEFGFNKKLKIIPENIVAIITHPDYPKTRRKAIYTKEETKKGLKILRYYLNSDEFNFTKLSSHINPLNHYLLIVSKNAIINVDCYELIKNKELQILLDSPELKAVSKIIASNEKPIYAKKHFEVIKNGIRKRLYLQKFMIGYKSDFKIK